MAMLMHMQHAIQYKDESCANRVNGHNFSGRLSALVGSEVPTDINDQLYGIVCAVLAAHQRA